MVKEVISALRSQLADEIVYAKDSGYEDRNVESLIILNKFPFFNITSSGWEIGPTDNVNIAHLERVITTIVIQFATRSSDMTVAKQGNSGKVGIYDFADDIWGAIRSDPTLGGVVRGYLPGSSCQNTIVEAEGDAERFFIGAGEMQIKFYKDVGRK